MLPLDDIVDLAGLQKGRFVRPPVFIKIDTEGFELPVLNGAQKVIAQWSPVFLVECITIEGRDDSVDLRTFQVKRFLEDSGYHLYLHRGTRLVPRTANDVQEGYVCDLFAAKRKYEPDDSIGRFSVGHLTLAESIAWLAEMAVFPLAPHRMHAAGVLARWIGEGRRAESLLELARALVEDPNPQVAEFAERRLGTLKI